MEEMLETPFYHQDDILSRSMPPSILYDKHSLDLNLQSCVDLAGRPKHGDNGQSPGQAQNSMDSPSLDFLKLGSPDLERMFMSFQGNVPSSPTEDSNAAFTLPSDQLTGPNDNSFAEALQQLHDQQENILVEKHQTNKAVGEKSSHANIHVLNVTPAVAERKQSSARQKRHRSEEDVFVVSNASSNNTNNNDIACINNNNGTNAINNLQRNIGHVDSHIASNNVSCAQQQVPARAQMSLGLQVPPNHGIVSMNNHVMPQEQFIINNMAVLGSANHHMMPSQMQQEIAFLNHAMGYIPERDGIPQALIEHVTMADPSMQFRHLQGRFQENTYVEPGFQERSQMQVNGIENMQMLGHMDEQTKIFLENNPHYQPIDLELQELVKRERKKLRNRVASSKCRKRKLEREARLDHRVKELKEKNIELGAVANALKQQVCDLKQRVMDHVSEGCQIVLAT